MTKRVAIYARVSKAYKKIGEERVTIEGQLAECEEYCQQHGYVIVARYVDKYKYQVRGKSVHPSASRKDRPNYQALLAAARREEFDIIVAWKEDRLYRGVYAAMPLADILDKRSSSLTVELVQETFDRSMLEIKAAMGKLELENTRTRMIMGRRTRLKRGEVPGGPTRYGYNKVNKRLVVNDAEAQVIRQVFGWYNRGENSMEIRRRLNATDILPRISKIWPKTAIQNIVTFEGYATGEYTTMLDGEIFTIPCPPIISMSTWRKAQETRKRNKKQRGRNVKNDYLCRGMLVCPCGWKWGARSCHTKKEYKRKSGYYACQRPGVQPERVHPDCPGTIGAKKLDNYVWNFVITMCENPAIVQAAIDKKIAQLRAEQGNIEVEAERVQRELDRIAEERQWVITQARKNRITESDMEMQLIALDFQAIDLRKKRDDKATAIKVQQQVQGLEIWASEYLADVSQGVQALNIDVAKLGEKEQTNLYTAFEAGRFAEKFAGDKLAALRWAILEEKRRAVRMLVSKVLVVKGKNGEKIIVPKLALEIPIEYASLAYSRQALAYIKRKEPA